MTHHVAGLRALEAVRRQEVVMEDSIVVETVGYTRGVG